MANDYFQLCIIPNTLFKGFKFQSPHGEINLNPREIHIEVSTHFVEEEFNWIQEALQYEAIISIYVHKIELLPC